jgi:hypothetical protein
MTLVVATAFAEGIVIGADSRTTINDMDAGGQPRIATDYAEKLFDVRGLAVGTSGCANFNNKNIVEHMADFEKSLKPDPTFDHLCSNLGNYFEGQYRQHVATIRATALPPDPQQAAVVQKKIDAAVANAEVYFLVAGLDGGKPRIDRIYVTQREAKLNPNGFQLVTQFKPGFGGVAFIGTTDVCERLIHGYSMSMLKTAGIPPALDQMLRSTATKIPFGVWKMQDAFNLTWTLFHITMFMQRVQISRPLMGMEHPNVGGEIDLITITPKDGLKWEQRKATFFRQTLPPAPPLSA